MKKTKMSGQTDTLAKLESLAGELLNLLGTTSRAQVTFDEVSDSYNVTIEAGSETGLLIGKKGETLGSLQIVLGMLLKQSTGEWHRVSVNVGDYREKEEDYLRNLGLNAAARAKETGTPQSLYNLNPAQRRIIHMILAEDGEVLTESQGDGAERYLVISSKK